MNINADCLGCRLANQIQTVNVVYEDEHICCFLDHDPFNEGHTLILPKKHVVEAIELDDETLAVIMKASLFISKAINELYHPDGITICQNGGVFNELTHYHMHVVPRFKGQPFADYYADVDFDNEKEKSRLAETRVNLENAIRVLPKP